MHIELIDHIRCPRDHPFTWLVAQTAQISLRDVVTGTLGCPTCGAKFLLNEGVLDLRLGQADDPKLVDADAGEEQAMRTAALLALTEPGGMILLAGQHAAVAPMVSQMQEGTHVLVLNPSTRIPGEARVSVVLTDGQLPLRDGAARGIVLDEAHASTANVEAAVRMLADNGRLVAPAGSGMPPGVRELARDEHEWLAERPARQEVVPLRRG